MAVPLSASAVIVLREQLGKHPVYLFSFRSKPVRQVSTKTWYQALERVGIQDCRWHDWPHTWASWHAQAGTPVHVLGGWQIGEGFDVGEDVGSPVDFTYKPPFKFTGTIDNVTIELK
jgi:hypothetical protein